MPEVTVTFQETGEDPASFVIPDWAVAALQQWVNDPANPEPVSGKAELFKNWAIRDLIKPLCQRYNSYPAEVMTLLAQKATLDAEVAAAIGAAVASAVVIPEP